MNGSYRLSSFTENQSAEVNRLKAQVELFFDKEFEVFKKFGLKDGMNIIECGSGPGFLILNILKRFTHCKATALEIDPFLFEVLKQNSEDNGLKLYSPVLGSIYEIDLPDESVDFAVTRLVIEHLQYPMKAFIELKRILKPNGILVVVSNDFAYHVLTYPVISELDDMFEAYNRSRFSEGGNPLIGRQLPVLFQRAGFKDIDLETATAHSTLKGDKAMLNAENVNISRSLVKEGFLNPETLENLMRKWAAMLKNPDHVIYRQLFIVGGRKDLNSETQIDDKEFSNSANKDLIQSKSLTTEQNDRSIVFSDIVNTCNSPEEIEEIILNVWKEVLSNDQITKNDNFFQIGGDSVMLPEIIEILRNRYNITLRTLDFFEYPTVQKLVELTKNNPAEINDSKNDSLSAGISRPERIISEENILQKIQAQRNKFKSRKND